MAKGLEHPQQARRPQQREPFKGAARLIDPQADRSVDQVVIEPRAESQRFVRQHRDHPAEDVAVGILHGLHAERRKNRAGQHQRGIQAEDRSSPARRQCGLVLPRAVHHHQRLGSGLARGPGPGSGSTTHRRSPGSGGSDARPPGR